MRTSPGLCLAAALLAAGCALSTRRPILYPNAQLLAVGKEEGKREVAACERLADEFSDRNAELAQDAEDLAVDTAGRGAAGAAAGAVGGAIRSGQPGTGAAVGAATSATYGLVRGMFRKRDPHPVRKRMVERCLADRGYEVAGWR